MSSTTGAPASLTLTGAVADTIAGLRRQVADLHAELPRNG